ncbi:MAG: GNAT family N-acetyltransferase [Candidatus Ozemobacteraceae bacterium]
MIPVIRLLSLSDFGAAESILNESFLQVAHRRTVLETGLKITPDGWFLAQVGGMPVGLVGATCYQNLAWIGMMAVHPQFQSNGIGRRLMIHVLSFLEKHGIETVLLDATSAGHPLYRSLGFVDADESRVYEQNPTLPTIMSEECDWESAEHLLLLNKIAIRPITEKDLLRLAAFDFFSFGANRGKFLTILHEILPGRCFLAERNGSILGYSIAQQNRIGPWVALNDIVAEKLFQTSLQLPFSGQVQVIVPQKKLSAEKILHRNGFSLAFANRHMWKSLTKPNERREFIFGQGNFAYG